MKNSKFNQDSMSLVIDDRFLDSQSDSQNIIHQQQHNSDNSQDQKMVLKNVQSNQLFIKQQQRVNYFQSASNFLAFQSMQLSNHPQSIRFGQNKQSKQSKTIKIAKMLQKKKQRSKIYRQKKKKFIQKLQQQNNQYKQKCIELQQKILNLQRQIGQLKYDNQNHTKFGYQKQYQKDIELLKSFVEDKNITTQELAKYAMKMRQKYGPAGCDRKHILNYYMSQYINVTMADFQKYLFSSVLKKSGPFGQLQSKLDQKIDEILQFSEYQKYELKNKVIHKLYPIAINFSNSCKSLYKSYVELLDEAKKFHDSLTLQCNYRAFPELTKMIVWFDENKNMPEVRKLKQEWIKLYSGQLDQQINTSINKFLRCQNYQSIANQQIKKEYR